VLVRRAVAKVRPQRRRESAALDPEELFRGLDRRAVTGRVYRAPTDALDAVRRRGGCSSSSNP
jgi:hypothetical protein